MPSDTSGDTASDAGGDDNRRKFPRLRESCSIRVRPLTGALLPDGVDGVDAMTVNISGGGLCYPSELPVEVGGFMAVELLLPEFPSAVLALARTAYSAPEGPPYEVGLEFWWVGWGDDSAQRAIADFIKTELRSREAS